MQKKFVNRDLLRCYRNKVLHTWFKQRCLNRVKRLNYHRHETRLSLMTLRHDNHEFLVLKSVTRHLHWYRLHNVVDWSSFRHEFEACHSNQKSQCLNICTRHRHFSSRDERLFYALNVHTRHDRQAKSHDTFTSRSSCDRQSQNETFIEHEYHELWTHDNRHEFQAIHY